MDNLSIAVIGFELAYYNAAVQHINHYVSEMKDIFYIITHDNIFKKR